MGENTAENFYHAFILGILVNLDGKYRVMSDAESGDGRPDVLIIPKDTSKKGVVIEFKTAKSSKENALRAKAKEALDQINKMNYTEMAIVFHGKKVHINYDIKQIT